MKKLLAIVWGFVLLMQTANGQKNPTIQEPTLGVHFFLVDFKTAMNVRSSTLSTVVRNHEFGKLKEMTPGLAINYIKGLTSNFDVSSTLAGTFIDYPQRNRESFGRDAFLLEGDVSIRGKMFPNNYYISPYLQTGIGASMYQGYFGAFIPAGVGFQINFFTDAYFLINAQYRIPITETVNYHFFYSIGLAGNIGKKKE